MHSAGYTAIPLHDRHGEIKAFAVVDHGDAHLASKRWSPHGDGYAVRYAAVNGRQTSILLHREILGLRPGDGTQVDHINGNRLDCRRANLRIGTHSLNAQNVPLRGGTSSYRGVCWHDGKSRAYATLNGRQHNLGRFEREEDAAEAARAFRAQHMPFANERRAA